MSQAFAENVQYSTPTQGRRVPDEVNGVRVFLTLYFLFEGRIVFDIEYGGAGRRYGVEEDFVRNFFY